MAVDFENGAALREACAGGSCLVSALNGLEPVMIGLQGRLLDAAIAAAVPRFMPSDYSLDFTKTRPGDNRNLDLRRRFMERIGAMPIRPTSVLNGAFADLLTGQAPIILHGRHRILYWGDADQKLDFTTKDDVADYAAAVAQDDAAPRLLRIAGASVSPRELADIMTELTGTKFSPFRAGGIGLLSAAIAVTRTLSPRSAAPFPIWQGLQYMRDMASGRGKPPRSTTIDTALDLGQPLGMFSHLRIEMLSRPYLQAWAESRRSAVERKVAELDIRCRLPAGSFRPKANSC